MDLFLRFCLSLVDLEFVLPSVHTLASALVTADEAIDVTFTNLAASNAISNNFLLPKEKLELSKKLEACNGSSSCESALDTIYKIQSDLRDEEFTLALNSCVISNDCDFFHEIHYDFRQELTEEGNAYFALLSPEQRNIEFVELSDVKSIFHTFKQDYNGNVISAGTEAVNYRKLIHPVIGYEIVLDENDNIVTDPVNAGSYNFYNPDSLFGNTNKLLGGFSLHDNSDVEPYTLLGNSRTDKTTQFQRVLRWSYLPEAVIKD